MTATIAPSRILDAVRVIEGAADGGRLAVAFSGGVDSTAVLALAIQSLGVERVVAVTADSPSLPRADLDEARALAERLGVEWVKVETSEMEDERYVANDANRCFYCKGELFRVVAARKSGLGVSAVATGAIADDLSDDRPGERAGREVGVATPLQDTGWTKEDVRAFLRAEGLPNAEKPQAACLASRIPHGTAVTVEALASVERAEAALRRRGYGLVRVRHLGSTARVEFDAQGWALLEGDGERAAVAAELATAGFGDVAFSRYGRP